jgi:hypothetical protein
VKNLSNADVDSIKVAYWVDQLNKLRTSIDSANENGLFNDKPAVYCKLTNDISRSLAELSEKPVKTDKFLEAKEKYCNCFNELNQLSNAQGFSWRFCYYYGGPALAYLIVFFVVILFIWVFFNGSVVNYHLLLVPSWAFLWGAMGGILNGFWKIWQHACYREIRKVWYIWYIVLPLMGAILGAVTYLILLAGLIATTGQSTVQSQFFPMLICALAGFSAKWAVDLIDKLTKLIQVNGT